jgi:hypothetical protein
VYISGAEAGEVGLTETCLISFCGDAPKTARQAVSPTIGKMLRTSIISSFLRHRTLPAEALQSATIAWNLLFHCIYYPLLRKQGHWFSRKTQFSPSPM